MGVVLGVILKGENHMSILSIASYASIWRGYDYFKEKRVFSLKQISESEF